MLPEVADVPDAEGRLLRAVARDEVEEDGGRGHWDQELALLHCPAPKVIEAVGGEVPSPEGYVSIFFTRRSARPSRVASSAAVPRATTPKRLGRPGWRNTTRSRTGASRTTRSWSVCRASPSRCS